MRQASQFNLALQYTIKRIAMVVVCSANTATTNQRESAQISLMVMVYGD